MRVCVYTYIYIYIHTYIHPYHTIPYHTIHYITLHYLTLHYITFIRCAAWPHLSALADHDTHLARGEQGTHHLLGDTGPRGQFSKAVWGPFEMVDLIIIINNLVNNSKGFKLKNKDESWLFIIKISFWISYYPSHGEVDGAFYLVSMVGEGLCLAVWIWCW